MKELAATMTPYSSALFVLVRGSTPDKVLEEVKGTGGTILKTSLSHAQFAGESQWRSEDLGLNRGFGVDFVAVEVALNSAVRCSLLRPCRGTDKENRSGTATQERNDHDRAKPQRLAEINPFGQPSWIL
jgi:Protein of unknown function (DUF1269)